MNKQDALRYIRSSIVFGNNPRDLEMIDKAADRMVQFGECAWHAVAQVTGKQCWCADCKPEVRRFA